MTDIDLDLDGVTDVELELQELKERGESNRVYTTGTNTEYAVYLEFGTRNMPPYPFFRPAIREFAANPEGFIKKNTEYKAIDAIPSTDALVEAVAVGLQTQIETNANAAGGTGRSPGVDADHPKVDTGNLRASIRAERVR
jgi:hypothetical protein